MTSTPVGVVRQIWRYPVKSMLGERLEEATVTTGGIEGDRGWALRSTETGNVLSAKKWARLLDFRSSYAEAPAGDVRVFLPGGMSVLASDAGASQAISEALGTPVLLERAAEGVKSKADIDPATVFGEVPIENIFPTYTRETMPPVFRLPTGTFFDSAAVHVLASGTLEHMRALCGEATVIDTRRFRPNIYVETAPGAAGFVEDEWEEGVLLAGEAVRIVDMHPALRCVMTTLPQGGLPRDPAVLRAAAKNHDVNVGVFASVGSPGRVRVGDPVFLES
ncbi:MAG: MOSC N-terminal beta barrel domain-containing protein [Dehalococcoidia bacterium]|nr:MOSC N-terminal beta barrel domain-containing protein [Dehalococcoidia bacterium]MCL4230807.1 MOSC N-terminal beta barrel domain-containing protein [Dehalococcoidia bacterium]